MAKRDEIRKRIAKVAEVLLREGVAMESTLRGCSAQEIDEIQTDVGLTLPLAYREFLCKMGREAGKFYVGSDIFYPRLLGITEAAHSLVAEDPSGISLPEDAISFIMHQGYQFIFIRANEGDNPPVYHYMEQSGEFVTKAEQLTEFLIEVAKEDW